jgi:poly(3-hydroxyoctanoate) depolymerase
VNVRERSVHIGGLRLHVREVGDGDPLLMINGIGAHTAMWMPLEAVLGDFRLIEFDAPGAGQSATPSYPVTIPALAWLTRRLLEQLGIARADVLGYSLGGLVAQELAIAAPEQVRRLVLVATSCGWGGIPGQPVAMLNVATPLRYWSPSFYRRTIGSMAGGHARRDPDWVQRHGELRRRHPPTVRGYFAQLMSASAWSSLPQLSRIHQPTLVVTGDDDPLVPAANSVLLTSRLPEARLLVAPGEGHLLLLDSSSAALDPIHDFLAAPVHTEARAWQAASEVGADEARAAIAEPGRQLQPWGALSALMRAAWPAVLG